MIWVLAIVAGLAAGIASLIYWVLAPNNLFFTFVNEGTAKAIVKAGEFDKALIQWEGYTLDDDWNVVEGEESHLFGGLRFYGFWPLWDVYIYTFRWTGIRENGELASHTETLDYILLKEDIYWARVERAEDLDLLPLEVGFILTIRVTNPYRALFRIQDWLEAVTNRIRPLVRDRISSESFKELITKPESVGSDIYADAVRLGLVPEFREEYGVLLRKIEVKDIDPPEEFRQTTLLQWQAERDRERILVEADAEQQRIATVYDAIRGMGDFGELVRTLEALEKSPGQGAKWVLPLPGMAGLFSRVFPGRAPETLTPEEIRELKEELRELKDKLGE